MNLKVEVAQNANSLRNRRKDFQEVQHILGLIKWKGHEIVRFYDIIGNYRKYPLCINPTKSLVTL